MAKITFTADDGSTQDFEITIPLTQLPPVATVTEVKVEESNGTEVITEPVETPAVEATETPAA